MWKVIDKTKEFKRYLDSLNKIRKDINKTLITKGK